MCYKYATPKLPELIEYLSSQPPYEIKDYLEYYVADGFTTPYMAITTNEEPHVIQPGRWGLMPVWVKTSADVKKYLANTLNAKCETVFELVSFKNSIGKNRCLIWASGFFEWKWNDEKGKSKTPYFIYTADKKPFTFGGIWTRWTDPETGEIIPTFSIITTEANSLLSEIHNNKKRMPLIIAPEDREKWLGNLDKDGIQHLMLPYPDGKLQAHTISKLITTRGVDTNVPEVQEPFNY